MRRKETIKVEYHNRPNKYFGFVALSVILIIFHVIFGIQTSVAGLNIASLEKEYENLAKEKREFEETLIRSQSLTEVNNSRENLGYSESQDFLYVKVNEPFAKLP